MKTKIIEVINSLSYRGGAQVFFYNLCNELSFRDDVELYIICLYDKIDPSFNSLYENRNLHLYTCGKKRWNGFKSSGRLKKIIKSINPDIINFHLNFLLTYFLAFGIKKRRWKLIKTYHSIPGNDLNNISYFLEKTFVHFNNLSFIAISNLIAKKSLERYKKAKTFTVYNAIKSNNIELNNQRRIDFLCVASLTQVKNHKLLFEAFKIVSHKHTQAKLVCVGGGPLKNEYIELLKRMDIYQKVQIVDETPNVWEFYANSKYFVLSSTREGNPISILEAMSCGNVIIAPKIGGIPDVVDEGVNGFLYEVGSKERLAETMEFVITNESKCAEISKNNIIKSKDFSIKKCAENYLGVFKTLINEDLKI